MGFTPHISISFVVNSNPASGMGLYGCEHWRLDLEIEKTTIDMTLQAGLFMKIDLLQSGKLLQVGNSGNGHENIRN